MLRQYILLLLLLSNCILAQEQLPLIPKPQNITLNSGNFSLNSGTFILLSDLQFQQEAGFINRFLKDNYGFELAIVNNSKSAQNTIVITKDATLGDEAYSLEITPNQIYIKASTNQGAFYAIQTLFQLCPVGAKQSFPIPCVLINDQPKFTWRGMHLDVARHFFNKEFIKKYIDYMAMYKMNTFHWHLTDDQGWRIEIKKYPELTTKGAWRKTVTENSSKNNKPYGGYYTQDEVQEIVAYAKERHITVIPEIEMPGHALAALSAYPELSCTGGPFKPATTWGVFDDVFCPKEETFHFLENVLTEVIALFPSAYIHIGGDECPKVRWKNCDHCQTLIKKENLKDEHELQSYFIKRIEKFLNAKGRKIIGWDEILEGGLAPNAAVMSWRGIEGGIAAAQQKHYVVMTPGSHCYFDHYQGEPKNEPLAFGGYTTVEKVYSLNPIPKELNADEAQYILGAQGNLWTEHIRTPEHVEYMIMPRMQALAEVVWGTSQPENFNDFQQRLLKHFAVLDQKGINYSKALFEITTKVQPSETRKGVRFALKSVQDTNGIRYTTDGTAPKITSATYSEPIPVTQNATIKTAYFENGQQKSAVIRQTFSITKATGKNIVLENPPHQSYATGGAFTLVDGMKGDRQKIRRDWLGFSGKDLVATIDLDKKEKISKIKIGVLENQESWIYYPKTIRVQLSDNGTNFQTVKELTVKEIADSKGIITMEINKQKARFVKVIALNAGKIPEGKTGAGADAWLFVDEIMVE